VFDILEFGWDIGDVTPQRNLLEGNTTMGYTVTEVVAVDDKKTRTHIYNIQGPQRETIESFWEWLKSNKTIKSYEIEQS
jgi:hypothetical protein